MQKFQVAWALFEQSDLNSLDEAEGDEALLEAYLLTADEESALLRSRAEDFQGRLRAVSVSLVAVPRDQLTTGGFLREEGDLATWVRISSSRSGGSFRVRLIGVGGEPDSEDFAFFAGIVEPLDPEVVAELDRAAERVVLQADQSADDLRRRFSQFGARATSALVHDVGQGSCVTVLDQYFDPVCSFDFGWPISFHSKTAPAVKPPSFESRIPVVLSHWDMDHWGLAIRSFSTRARGRSIGVTFHASALGRDWIVPGFGAAWGGVRLGPVALSLCTALTRRGNLTVWPSSLRSLSWGAVEILKNRPVRPRSGSRNQHGLSMLLGHHESLRVLLPGDADYHDIPIDWVRNKFTGLQATHHGGAYTYSSTPTPAERAWLAFSAGDAYGHPKLDSQQAHLASGWRNQVLTKNRIDVRCHCRHSRYAMGDVLLPTEISRVSAPRWAWTCGHCRRWQ